MNVTLAVLCDYALVDQMGKPSLIGLFTDYNAAAFPAVMPPIFLFVGYEASPGEAGQTKVIRIVFVDADGNQLGSIEQPITIGPPQFPGRKININQAARMDGTVVQKPGIYAFEIQIGGETKTAVQLHVHGGAT